MSLLQTKIDTVSFNSIRDDIVRFIPSEKVIEIWSPDYFNDLIQKIKFLFRMLINDQWSQPKPVEYGKNIRLRFSRGNFEVKVYNATGQSLIKIVPDDRREFIIPSKETSEILHPQISFKSASAELHVSMELF